MKGVAPFLGISAPHRRELLDGLWEKWTSPTSDELGRAAIGLANLPFREYHYAAYDLIGEYRDVVDEYFLSRYVEPLLTHLPWWDTVDGLVNAAVSPYCRAFDAREIIHDWSESGDRWLIRAAITHQRGWRTDTELDEVFAFCERHWASREFFIAKAIGWALRDIARDEPLLTEHFLDKQVGSNPVATREARRGIDRALSKTSRS
jgi:3-methyladenine DNA glycosylase AlkD